ncbi:MAG: hypothetical protein IPK10_08060 [Bacteroidetes bacterium]|nr:hypothetical protein [Bacteroidota bacterium]
MKWLSKAIILHYSHSIKQKQTKNLNIIKQHEEAIDKIDEWTGLPTLEKLILDIRTLFGKFENRFEIEQFVREKIQISIVGHSRGGHVAIALNNSLPFNIHFLGLLDPVDWDKTLKVDTNAIEKKYKSIYHAVRNVEFEKLSSQYRGTTFTTAFTTRIWFGQDGLNTNNIYNTSHGGMGGSAIGKGFVPVMHDITCNETYIDPFQKILNNLGSSEMDYSNKLKALISNTSGDLKFYEDLRSLNTLEKIVEVGKRESERVKTDFFNAAINAGLKFTKVKSK